MLPTRSCAFLLPTSLITLPSQSGKVSPPSLHPETFQAPLDRVRLCLGSSDVSNEPISALFWADTAQVPSDRYLLYITAFLQGVKHFAAYMKCSGMKICHLCSRCLNSRVKGYNQSDNPTSEYLRIYHDGCWEGKWARSAGCSWGSSEPPCSWKWINAIASLEAESLRTRPQWSSHQAMNGRGENETCLCVNVAMLLKLYTVWFQPTF